MGKYFMSLGRVEDKLTKRVYIDLYMNKNLREWDELEFWVSHDA